MQNKRRAISKKTRFEVFKRDAFTCQYCGAHPPGVLLHVDHILAVAAGGTNAVDNLLTACEPCNLGKGARDLKVAPQTISQKAATLAEREAQLLAYQELMEERRERLDGEVWRVIEVLHGPDCGRISFDRYVSTKRFVESLGVHVVLDAAEIAAGANVPTSALFRYFCGICWGRIRNQEAA